MINYDRQKNDFEPGDLVRWWITKKSKNIIYLYLHEDIEDPWMAVVLGPEGCSKIRYVQLERIWPR